MEHQDWEDVIFHAKKDPKQLRYDTKNIEVIKKTTPNNQFRKIEKACENDTYQVRKVPTDLQQSIQQARQQQGFTQKQLATMCNLQTSVIRDYEAGVAIPTKNEIATIKRILKI
jgi:ribosome-binding protein aMBF1 (putative translation factor)